ncbi:hypothetical protein scyTo_0016990, partial [Scyliorhinus torazame]|nr:hypothetical protein [Scyliorhinus torazame]
MLRRPSRDTSDPEQQMSPYSPNHKQLCNGGYQSPREEEDQRAVSACSKLSLFDKLTLSHNIWLQLGIEPACVKDVLGRQPPG